MTAEREAVRKLIGLVLLALFILVVAGALFLTAKAQSLDPALLGAIKTKADAERLAVVLKLSQEGAKADHEALAALLNIVLGPIVALIGSVTGFYFGSRRDKS